MGLERHFSILLLFSNLFGQNTKHFPPLQFRRMRVAATCNASGMLHLRTRDTVRMNLYIVTVFKSERADRNCLSPSG